MKTRIALVVLVVLFGGVVLALQSIYINSDRGFQHLNTQVLGASVDDPIQPLRRWRIGDLRPTEVSLALSSNQYCGATLTFPKEITPREAVRSIETAFVQCKALPGQNEPRSWVEKETGFSIILTVGTNAFAVIYQGTRPPREATIKDVGVEENPVFIR